MKRTFAMICSSVFAISLCAMGFGQAAGPTGTQGTLQAPAKHKSSPNYRVLSAAAKEIGPTLGLDKTQQDQLDDLNKKSEDALSDIQKNEKGPQNKTERQQKMRDLGESYHKQFFAILTPSQMQQFNTAYKDFLKKWKAEHQKKGGSSGAPTTTTGAGGGSTTGGG